MTDALATVVDIEALLDTVIASVVAGLGITLIFSLAILGTARFIDSSRDGRPASAALFGALAVLAAVAFFVAIAVGLVVMTTK